MRALPAALAPMSAYKQFILYDKATKQPLNPYTVRPFPLGGGWQQDPTQWTDADTALLISSALPDVGVGFFLTDQDPFFFFDLAQCAQNGQWSDLAQYMCQVFQGVAVEVSQSGTGLHIIGTGTPPEHGCKNTLLGLELYHQARYIALTGTGATGDCRADCSQLLPWLVSEYFPKSAAGAIDDWTDTPVDGYTSTDTDAELIERALTTVSAGGAFGGRVTFRDLWEERVDVLAGAWPSETSDYDRSQADASLAQHLAFWTGSNCERIRALMMSSGLVRDKWQREDYLPRTIMRAVGLQTKFFSVGPATPEGVGAIQGTSKKHIEYGERCRAQLLASATPEQVEALSNKTGASFWIENQGQTPAELVEMVTPMESEGGFRFPEDNGPMFRPGYQFLTLELQAEYFEGLVYVNDRNAVWWSKTGQWFGSEQFNSYFGGYEFQLDNDRNRKTKKPWEALTANMAIKWPRVESTIFKPDQAPGAILKLEGVPMLNTYVPVETPRQTGDATPFAEHLAKLLPDDRDRTIVLSYMAACVQHKGHKFQWAPLIQGVEGNGKTLLTRCIEHAIGKRYRYRPRASDLDSKYNDWLAGRLFIGVEDIYIPDARKDALEVLKPMITNGDGLELEGKRIAKVTVDICCNFVFNCNKPEGIHKNRNDRRIAPFFTAQQTVDDLERDGMTPEYFTALYGWLRDQGGYAIVHDYLATYQIQPQYNPAVEAGGLATRAPTTTSTDAAVELGLGGVEQAINEALEEGRPGFKGGWISSVALDHLLQEHRKAGAVKPNSRKALLEELGFVPHPGLKNGRATRPVALDGGKKPRLYVRVGHLAAQLTGPSEIVGKYEQAQALSGEQSEAMQKFS